MSIWCSVRACTFHVELTFLWFWFHFCFSDLILCFWFVNVLCTYRCYICPRGGTPDGLLNWYVFSTGIVHSGVQMSESTSENDSILHSCRNYYKDFIAVYYITHFIVDKNLNERQTEIFTWISEIVSIWFVLFSL